MASDAQARLLAPTPPLRHLLLHLKDLLITALTRLTTSCKVCDWSGSWMVAGLSRIVRVEYRHARTGRWPRESACVSKSERIRRRESHFTANGIVIRSLARIIPLDCFCREVTRLDNYIGQGRGGTLPFASTTFDTLSHRLHIYG